MQCISTWLLCNFYFFNLILFSSPFLHDKHWCTVKKTKNNLKCMAAQGAKHLLLKEIMVKYCFFLKAVNDWQKRLPNKNSKIKVKYPNVYYNFS